MDTQSFLSVIEPFKAVFLDSYGVLKNHRGLIDGVQQTVDFIRERGIALRILTNDASRSQQEQFAVFRRLGLRSIEQEEIITSGMLAKQYLQHKVKNGKIAYLGTENAASYILESGNTSIPASEVDLDRADEIDAFVFLDDEGFDWNRDINTTVNLLRRKAMPVIVANSDKLYPVSRNDVALATGSVAQLVESILNRSFIHFGKPDSQMFMYAFGHLNQQGQYDRDDILMVGDTLHTDILGGNKFGLKTTLVLSGNTSGRNAGLLINSTGIIPDYVCESIVS
ncbi:MAG: HAD-IIA family hydrolase [Phaeodactylibacter sp.]|nr:HAD-IIA family hydrolase [Phaeodactylibacter sp.]